jgi:hypothetical protein
MTGICGGGTSSPKSGVTDVMYGGAALSAYFAAKGIPYLSEVALFLGLVPFFVSSQCATDPLAMPTWTTADSTAILQLQFGTAFTNALAKATAILYNFLWSDLCQCDVGPQPPPPVPPPPPAGLIIVNTTGTVECANALRTLTVNSVTGATYGNYDQMAGFLPTDGTSRNITADGAPNHLAYGIPPTITSVKFTSWPYINPNAGCHFQYGNTAALIFYDAAGNFLGANPCNTDAQLPSTVTTKTIAVGGSARYWYIAATANAVVGCVFTGQQLTTQAQFFCGTGGLSAPCCTDPAVMSMLVAVIDQVNLIQRQAVPFAYVHGAVHGGLTNSGTLAATGLLGVLIQVTAYPPANRVIAGEPDYVYDLGWISIESADGFIDEVRLRNPTQVWAPRIAASATKIGYALRAGVTATITELDREP